MAAMLSAKGAAPLDFYFDFGSPYGYFMAEKIEAVAAQHQRTVRWRPILLFAVLRGLSLPAPLDTAAKRNYMHLDFERSARFLGIDYRMPSSFPAATQHAARAFYAVAAIDADAAVRFAKAVMRAHFREGVNIGDVGLVAQLAAEHGVGDVEQARQRITADAPKAVLAAAVDEAVQRQVIGSPFVIVDGEPFFGVDRLPQIESKLSMQAARQEQSS